jgi:dihydroflavonol-4-reductase
VPDTLITGATGFVGGAVLRHLAAAGRSVRALSRRPKDDGVLRDLGAEEAVRGDLFDPESLRRAAEGCRVVYHVAGVNRMCAQKPDEMVRANVEGSRAVVAAAAAAGVEKVVYTSSAATIGEAAGVVATEKTPHRGSYNTAYEHSKHLAEIAVFEEAAERGVPVVSVNPSSVQGPGRTGGTARLLIAYLNGRLRFAVDVPMSLVFVDDCATAHLLAERCGVAGERYLVSGATITVSEAVGMLSRVAGEARRVSYLPAWAVRAAALPIGAVFRMLGRDAPLCREAAAAMLHGHRYDGSKAERDLGLRYTPVEDWLAEAVAWYREQGLVG